MNEKLTKISRTVAENAKREASGIIEGANRAKNAEIERETARLADEVADFIREESVKIEGEAKNSVVIAGLDYKKDLLAARGEYIEKIFDAALEKLREFAASEAYAAWFAKKFDQIDRLPGDTGTVKLRGEDAALFQKIAQGRTFEVTDEIKLGGFVAESDTRVIDLTLDAKYRDELQKFVCVGAFIIDK